MSTRTFLIVHHDGTFYRESYIPACNMMRAYREFLSWRCGHALSMRAYGEFPATLYIRDARGWFVSPRTPF